MPQPRQIELDFEARPVLLHPGITVEQLAAFVQRVRACGIGLLRELKKLVDEALQQETLVINDEDIPF